MEKLKLTNKDLITVVLLPIVVLGTILTVYFSKFFPYSIKIVCYATVAAVAFLSLIFLFFGFLKTYKSFFIALVMILLFALVFLILEKTGFMEIFKVPDDCEDKKACISENMKNYLKSTGKWSTVFYIFLQFLQTAILPIPSFVLTGAGNMLYSQAYGNALGPVINSGYGFIGVMLGAALAFFMGRRFGVKLVVWIVGEEALIKTLKILKGRDTLILTLMFLLPFFPDDLLCFVAGLSSMGWTYFLVVSAVSRLIVLFGSSYMLNLLPLTTWWGWVSWGLIGLAILALFYYFVKKGDKIMDYIQRKFKRKNGQKKNSEFDRITELIETLSKKNKNKGESEDKNKV